MTKEERVARAAKQSAERQSKALRSLAHCLARSNVMRYHHDGLVLEMLDPADADAFTLVKKQRFAAYVCFWFAGLAAVIERHQELSRRGTIPAFAPLDGLLSEAFIDILKPFRNAVAHCSDHDDERVLALLGAAEVVPAQAAAIADAFRDYFVHYEPSIYSSAETSEPPPA